jgi:hypothetical protein
VAAPATSTRARTAAVLGGTVVATTALASPSPALVDADDAFVPLQAGPVASAALVGVLSASRCTPSCGASAASGCSSRSSSSAPC